MSTRQMLGTLTPSSGNGWQPRIANETKARKLIKAPFLLVYFFVTFSVLSALSHKEMRFITTLVQIGQIAQAYQLTWCFDCRQVLLQWLRNMGLSRSTWTYGLLRFTTGWMIKFLGLFIVVK